MTRKSACTPLRIALLTAIWAGCGEPSGPDTPVPGTVQVVLATSETDVGAILVAIEGPAPAAVEGRPQDLIEWYVSDSLRTRVAAFGVLTPGTFLTLSLPDTRPGALAGYRLTVIEVATAAFALLSPSQVQVSLRPPVETR